MNHTYMHKATGINNPHLYFLDIPYVLQISNNNEWRLYSEEYSYDGKTKEEFGKALEDLKIKYELQCTKTKRDKIIIYMKYLNDIHKVVEDSQITYLLYDFCYELEDIFECREYTHWFDNRTLGKFELLSLLQELFEKFKKLGQGIPYTPASYGRKLYRKEKKQYLKEHNEEDIVENIYPLLFDYFYIKSSLYAGLRYCRKTHPCKYDMLYLDITSAYTFTLLTDKYPISFPEEVNPDTWEEYLIRPSKGSVGTYEITYFCSSSFISCWKDVEDNELQCGTHTVTINLTDVDLDLFLHQQFMNIHEIKCVKLMAFDMDYLPAYYRKTTQELYMEKQASEKNSVEREINKIILNASAYGNLLYKQLERDMEKLKKTSFSETKIQNELQHKRRKILENSAGVPQWGVWTTAYIRKVILSLAPYLQEWVYTHTDSIICKDTQENREKINAYNEFLQDRIKQYCERFGEDFETLKNLGQFEITEAEVVRTIDTATYAWKDRNTQNIIVKASGRTIGDHVFTDEIFTEPCPRLDFPIKSKNHEKEIDANILLLYYKLREQYFGEKYSW